MSDLVDEKISFVEKFDFESICSKIANENQLTEVEEPFYVCNIGDVLRKHQLWLSSFPRITPFYAVKCNPNPLILKLMANMGLSFDCASQAEISTVMDEGVTSSRIIYANPCKQTSHIKYAASAGVDLMTIDTVSEVEKIKRVFPTASLVIRIFVETSKARCPLGLKFGASNEETERILLRAQELQMNVVGVSFHVGSGCFDASVYGVAIRRSKEVFILAQTYGYFLRILDIGGGFPGDLHNPSSLELFYQVRDVINSSIELCFSEIEFKNLEIISEPGRFYVSSAFQLCCAVTSVKGCHQVSEKADQINSPNFNYYINDGVYGSFNCVIFDHYTPDSYLLSPSVSSSDVCYPSIIWGPTCDSMDKVCEKMLPALKIDDKIVFSDMGAYTMAAGCTFNGFPRPSVHYYFDKEHASIISAALGLSICQEYVEESRSESDNFVDNTWISSDCDVYLTENIVDGILKNVLIYQDTEDSFEETQHMDLNSPPMMELTDFV